MATTPAMRSSEIVEHGLEVRVFFEDRFVHQGDKPMGVDVKIAQFFFKLQAVFANVTVHTGEALLTALPAWCKGFKDLMGCHAVLLVVAGIIEVVPANLTILQWPRSSSGCHRTVVSGSISRQHEDKGNTGKTDE